MRSFILYIFLAAVFFSCEESIQLDLDQAQPKVIIEGQVTDRPGYQFVKVSRSAGFYESGETPRITNANVSVTNDLGETVTFVHNPNAHPDSAGYYLPQNNFIGQIGRTYTLNVVADGQSYEAHDKMVDVMTMDSLRYQPNEFQEEDPEITGKIYELLMYAKERQGEKNFYLFKFYRNDSLTYFNDTDIYYTDDELLAENIDGFPSPVYYGIGDEAIVEVYSISREGYVFYNDLSSNLNNDGGGMFGPIPATPRTNLSNGALGFFQVSSVNTSALKVE